MKSFFPIKLAGRLLAAILALPVVSCGGGADGGSTADNSGIGNITATGASGTNGAGAAGTSGATGATGATGTAGVVSTATAGVFGATLTGAQETPPRSTAATGTGVVLVDQATRLMRATVTTAGINGIAAHIHIAPPGAPGPIVFPMTEAAPGSGVWVTEATLTAEQLQALTAGTYYFNVHSAAYPDGEIRGQITPLATAESKNTATAGAGSTGAGITMGPGTSTTGTTGIGTTSSSAGAVGSISTLSTGVPTLSTGIPTLTTTIPTLGTGIPSLGTSGTGATGLTPLPGIS